VVSQQERIIDDMNRSDIMRRIRSSDTGPERELRSLMWSKGFRFRKQHKVANVSVDVALLGPKIAILVDGCFWHGCPLHYRRPKSRRDYWDAKLERNKRRDARNDRDLSSEGWLVLRIWEHETSEDALERVMRAIQCRLSRTHN